MCSRQILSLRGSSVSSPLGSPATLALWQMDPKFLRNLKWSKRHNGKGRGGDEE